jgi:hypothetical protein
MFAVLAASSGASSSSNFFPGVFGGATATGRETTSQENNEHTTAAETYTFAGIDPGVMLHQQKRGLDGEACRQTGGQGFCTSIARQHVHRV